MKGLKWLLVLSSFALLSCSPSSTSSENPSPAGSSSSSSGNSSPASSEDPDAKYFIDYEDYSLPEGTFVSEEEWDMMVEQAAYNRKYNVGLDRYLSEENSDYAVRNPAEAASRSYEGSFQDVHWNFYQNRIAASVLDSQDVSSNFGGYSTRDYEEEVFFITGDDSEGYNLYFNHYETVNDIEKTPYTTLVTSSQTYDTNPSDVAPFYDNQVVYFAAYSQVGTAFSPDVYDAQESVTQNSFVKDNSDTIYMTNYNVSTSLETVSVDGASKQVPTHFLSGTQWVYEKDASLGYVLTKYTTMNMRYSSVDYYGERLDTPAVTHKEVIVTEWNYAGEGPIYPYGTPSVITPVEVPYSVTLDAYDVSGTTPTVTSSATFANITSLYTQLVDTEFSGYAFRYISRSAAGNYKVSVKNSTSTLATLGWSDITHFEDYGLTLDESTSLDNGIEDSGGGFVAYTVLLSNEGAVTRFGVTFLV